MTTLLTIALSKGRIFKETLPLLAAAGIVPADDPETSRKLILDTDQPDVKLVIIRATDVPTYVQYGAADLGVAGKDVLLEHGGEGLYEPLDLRHRPLPPDGRGPSRPPSPTEPPAHRHQVRQHHPPLFRRPGSAGGSYQAVRLDGTGAAGGVGGLHRRCGGYRQYLEGQWLGATGTHRRHQFAIDRQQGRHEDEACPNQGNHGTYGRRRAC